MSLGAGGAGCRGRLSAALAEVWTQQADVCTGTMGHGQIDWVQKGGMLPAYGSATWNSGGGPGLREVGCQTTTF